MEDFFFDGDASSFNPKSFHTPLCIEQKTTKPY